MPRGGGFGRGGFRGGYGMRRVGVPLLGPRMGGMGGMGGMDGSPLFNMLMAGGLGYLFGSRSGQGQGQGQLPVQQAAGQAQPPVYPAQYPLQYPPYPPYQNQGPSAAPSAARAPAPAASADSDRLAQLKLLGELHAAGALTDEEFQREKEHILNRA